MTTRAEPREARDDYVARMSRARAQARRAARTSTLTNTATGAIVASIVCSAKTIDCSTNGQRRLGPVED